MWFKLIDEYRPRTFCEIGVYRGQTLSLLTLIANCLGLKVDAWGVSPLSSAGDSLSTYKEIDYTADISSSFARFNLGRPQLLKAKSQDAAAIEFLSTREWDCVYVDGSHELEDVAADVELARACTQPGAVLVLDDASLYSGYRPYPFSFAGHPGPSTIASQMTARSGFEEIGTSGHNRVYRRV